MHSECLQSWVVSTASIDAGRQVMGGELSLGTAAEVGRLQGTCGIKDRQALCHLHMQPQTRVWLFVRDCNIKRMFWKDTGAKKHFVLACTAVISTHWHAGLDRRKVIFVPSLSFCSAGTHYECINQLLSSIQLLLRVKRCPTNLALHVAGCLCKESWLVAFIYMK